MATLSAELFRRKPVEMEAESGSETEESELSRSLDWITLLVFLVWTAIVIAWVSRTAGSTRTSAVTSMSD